MCGIFLIINYNNGNIDENDYMESLEKLRPRGPDSQRCIIDGKCFIGFTRLAIMDLSKSAMQPFKIEKRENAICTITDDKIHNYNNIKYENVVKGEGTIYSITNGEIYNYKSLRDMYDIKMKTECDCEVIASLYEKIGFENMLKELDAEFATIIVDNISNKVYAGRDRFGVRPLFYGYSTSRKIIGFASEAKALHDVMEVVMPVIPNMYYEIDLNEDFNETQKMYEYYNVDDIKICERVKNHEENINDLLTSAVKKRIVSDRPIGFLLSGGLDSSLIVSIASTFIDIDKIVCFTIGIEGSPDVEAAKKVVEYLGIKNHHVINFTVEDGLNVLEEVIRATETYDTTTIRASTPQYLLAKYIKENTNIRVVLSGEGSDEIYGGYRYFRDAPNPQEFDIERRRLIKDLYMFDNLRTDRTVASNGIEVRAPFLDFEHVNYLLSVNAELLMSSKECIEKKLLRDSFNGYLPTDILYRSKEAFSDAVSSKDINWYKSVACKVENMIADDELKSEIYEHNQPMSKEALYYRRIFNKFYSGRDKLIGYYWLSKFQKEVIHDPSATVLNCY